jgi:hypothetical protein
MLYRFFSSLKTSVFILSLMCLVFLIGTIFPQGGDIEDYREAGGKYITVVEMFDFLDIFMSPLFLCVIGLLVLNLAVCLYDRLRIFLRRIRKPIDFERLKNHPNIEAIPNIDIDDALERIGFIKKAETMDSKHAGLEAERKYGQHALTRGVRVYEKGLRYWWLSWFYHVGIILAVFGFFLTALFAFEKDVVLYPGRPEAISLYSKETRWNAFLARIGWQVPEKQESETYVVTLKEFRTEYYQGLRIDYPKDTLERLAVGLGVKKIRPSKKGFSYMPKMWLTRFQAEKPDGSIIDAELWVNRPFRTGGLTLYQMGYEQKVTLSIKPAGKNPPHEPLTTVQGKVIEAEARVPFQVKGAKGKFVLGSLKLGTLFRKDGTTENITPVTTVYYIPEESPSEREMLGKISLGGMLWAKDLEFAFQDFQEGSYLSYRKDPGVLLVGLASLFVFLGLFVRSLGAWYKVQCTVDNSIAYILISTRGILADRDRILRKLKKAHEHRQKKSDNDQ